ncbi:Nuclear transport factor 2 (NTF2) family protein with RNA binding (RRM-RBD-RNP motifs) domain [Euphorbia peplus]|nr:Nuclear transport factor 2 (NTF2) family protein with RNA binding (RRM-RBD-RNP motifs) domain [Euphorbia peplus]
MASPYQAAPVSAFQVGSFFVGQYYHVLQQQPDLVHQFYTEDSTMIRVDGDASESATTMLQIHTLAISLNFTAIEIKTINALESLHGGVMVMVSGSVKTREFHLKRKFVQSFFLAPQEKGYYVLNDIFQFFDEEIVYQPNPTIVASENMYHHHTNLLPSEDFRDTQLNGTSPIPEPPVSDYGLEEEAREYVSAVHIEDDPVDKYSLPEQQQQPDYENEIVVEEAPVEEAPTSFHGNVNVVHDTPVAALEESAEEPQKKTYASILRAKGQLSVSTLPSVKKSAPTTSEWNYAPPAPASAQQSDSVFSPIPDSGFEATEDALGLDDGEPKSVYVRNLPSDVTAEEIEQEFKGFGRIKPDGVFIRNRKDVVGVCYAFVEFEDLTSVQNAIQASPIQLAGRQVYIEERRPNSGIASRGGRGRGRGRGGYPMDAPRGRFGARGSGRGMSYDSNDYGRARGNGFYQRGGTR